MCRVEGESGWGSGSNIRISAVILIYKLAGANMSCLFENQNSVIKTGTEKSEKSETIKYKY